MKNLILFYAIVLTLIGAVIWLETAHPCLRIVEVSDNHFVCQERR